jgi:hypothetical protein
MQKHGEGDFRERLTDGVESGLYVRQDQLRRKAQRSDTSQSQVGIPYFVPLGPAAKSVRLAIHLDAELGLIAIEIEYVRPLWMLAADPVGLELPGPQAAP